MPRSIVTARRLPSAFSCIADRCDLSRFGSKFTLPTWTTIVNLSACKHEHLVDATNVLGVPEKEDTDAGDVDMQSAAQ
jgi:hypothetical protein